MTKFKVGDVEEYESLTSIAKTISLSNGENTFKVQFYATNYPSTKELSKKLESAIRRALNK